MNKAAFSTVFGLQVNKIRYLYTNIKSSFIYLHFKQCFVNEQKKTSDIYIIYLLY